MGTTLSNVRRYPMPIPEWCRTIWVSAEAQELWEPRITRIGEAWAAAELASVGSFREACLQTVGPAQLPELNQKAIERRLDLLVLARQGDTGTYQAGPVSIEGAASWNYRVALVTKMAAVPFLDAWRDGDDEVMGKLLGFPECCRAFFQRIWVDEKWIDTTWPMAQGETLVAGPVECNILLRWLGVRWVPHLPCSFDCEHTTELGREFRALMGDTDETRWMDELLDGPVQWSGWHGIAEIVTPVVKISAKTDATADKLTVRRKGTGYPEAGAAGLSFPYLREPAKRKATPPPAEVSSPNKEVLSLRYEHQSLHSVMHDYRDSGKPPGGCHHHDGHCHECGYDCSPGVWGCGDDWTDNGFSSRAAMLVAHTVVKSSAIALLESIGGDSFAGLLDLGCGTGVLANSIPAYNRHGVEIDNERAEAAQANGLSVSCTNIFRLDNLKAFEDCDLFIIMPGRLVESRDNRHETDAGVTKWIREFLRAPGERTRWLLVYAYGSWVEKYGTLGGLCCKAGLEGHLEHERTGPGVAAGIWRWK